MKVDLLLKRPANDPLRSGDEARRSMQFNEAYRQLVTKAVAAIEPGDPFFLFYVHSSMSETAVIVQADCRFNLFLRCSRLDEGGKKTDKEER